MAQEPAGEGRASKCVPGNGWNGILTTYICIPKGLKWRACKFSNFDAINCSLFQKFEVNYIISKVSEFKLKQFGTHRLGQ